MWFTTSEKPDVEINAKTNKSRTLITTSFGTIGRRLHTHDLRLANRMLFNFHNQKDTSNTYPEINVEIPHNLFASGSLQVHNTCNPVLDDNFFRVPPGVFGLLLKGMKVS
jgi:hypothetical protein